MDDHQDRLKYHSELSRCPKMKQGQLLMQRYRLCFERGNGTKYQPQADTCKQKSLVLAQRMKDHWHNCRVCRSEDFWFGV